MSQRTSAADPGRGAHTVKRAERPVAISLFTGAGGLDLGCEKAGFETRAAVEFDPVTQQTLLANAPRWMPGLAQEAVFSDIVTLNWALGDPDDEAASDRLDAVYRSYRSRRMAAQARALEPGGW